MQSIFAVLHGGKGHRQTDEGSKTNHIHHVFREHSLINRCRGDQKKGKSPGSHSAGQRRSVSLSTEHSAIFISEILKASHVQLKFD